ncbi:hypothetical protein SFB4_115G2 [Candidatus Arthromitus sp. SFB-4]|nr:hypothetical protein SFB4_115G2 [Candidatus Arthromitus sp. SFB-4]
MTLSILNLAEYYDKIIYNEKKRNDIVKFYVSCAKYQLNYYLNNFRNELGLFVNKITLDYNKIKIIILHLVHLIRLLNFQLRHT